MYLVPIHSVVRRIVVMFVDLPPHLLKNLFAIFRTQTVLYRGCGRRTANLWGAWSLWLCLGKCVSCEEKQQEEQEQRARNSPDPGGRWIHLCTRSATWHWYLTARSQKGAPTPRAPLPPRGRVESHRSSASETHHRIAKARTSSAPAQSRDACPAQ